MEKKIEVETQRQAWLDAREKKPHHKEASEKRELGDEVAASSTKTEATENGGKDAPEKKTPEKGDGVKEEVKVVLKHLMVDYHKTLAKGDHTISPENKLAMEKLLQHYDVTVCS